MPTDRPNPDELLVRVQAETAQASRGRLKVFFGMAPGVGKTYAMLQAARKLVQDGVDVVVGYVEPHIRPETQSLVLGLELLPRRMVTYRDRTVPEFDLDAALARRPQVLLVDELAHTNTEGSTHAKRWQDIQDVLAAGIDVYTTLNVQHLESLNDVVVQVTTIPVRETVPDRVFEQADEVELVDLPPDDLIERLRAGKVYLPEQAYRAIENFFRKGNLIALRELSLRKTAERVGAQALDYRQEHDISRIWPTSERLLVCVGPSPMSARLVRSASRMASRLSAVWVALHVESDRSPVMRPADRRRLDDNLRLAEELGAQVATVAGSDFADTVLNYARAQNITKIVVGRPQQSRWHELFRGAIVYELIRRCGDIDVYVISGDAEQPATQSGASSDRTVRSKWPYVWSLAGVAVCTLLCFPLAAFLAPTNLVMVYLACIVAIAVVYGRGPSILATVLGVAAFDVFFVPPYWTFAVSDTQYLLTFGVMLVTGLVISELAAQVRAQTDAARQRERRTAALYSLSRELTHLPTREAVAQAVRRIIRAALDVEVWICVPGGDGRFVSADPHPDAAPPAKDDGVIRWVYEHRHAAGRGTDTLPGAQATYLPLLVTDGIVGVLGVQPQAEAATLETQQLQLLQAFAGQVAGAIERCDLALQAEKVRLEVETERMRNALLSTVSHDLRTPLATITGAASLLVDGGEQLASDQRHKLAESILDETDRLHRLVANLLDLTRLEGGAIQVQREWQPLDEVIGVVLQRLDRQLREYPVEVHLADDLPPIPIDGLLIQQVLINLLDNAAKFSLAGTPIELCAQTVGRDLEVTVADRGPGLPPEQMQRVFEKFYRVDGHARAGSGIGLAICRGIIELHGGRITAENRPDGGALFRFTLPLGESHFGAPEG
jgi:two-component system sensor histidine kinase KdpD